MYVHERWVRGREKLLKGSLGENEAYDGLRMIQFDTTGKAFLGNEAQR